MWCWQSWHAYRAWVEAVLETGNWDLPALLAAAKLLALPYCSLAGLRIGLFSLFGSRWIVVLKDRLDVHRSGLNLHTRLAKIPREDIAGIGMERNGEWAKLVIERKRKRNFRVPWPLGEEEAVMLGKVLSQWKSK